MSAAQLQRPTFGVYRPNSAACVAPRATVTNAVKPTKHDDGRHASSASSAYPEYEHAEPGEGLFPMRSPGDFLSTQPDKEHAEATAADVAAAADGGEAGERYDPLRDGPLRYLGYANELGEAFAAFLPAYGVPASYAVAIGYVFVDTADKALRARREITAELAESLESRPSRSPYRGGAGTPFTAGATLVASTPSAPEKGADFGDSTPKKGEPWTAPALVMLLTSERALDTALWQLLASVAIPGFTIHTVVAAVSAGLLSLHLGDTSLAPAAVTAGVTGLAALAHADPTDVARAAELGLPTVAGLAAVPGIVHPIDNAVHALLNSTLRPVMRSAICDGAGGDEAGLSICASPFVSIDDEAGTDAAAAGALAGAGAASASGAAAESSTAPPVSAVSQQGAPTGNGSAGPPR